MDISEADQLQQIGRLKSLNETNEHALSQMKATLANLESRIKPPATQNSKEEERRAFAA